MLGIHYNKFLLSLKYVILLGSENNMDFLHVDFR
jgi:hypothetical protein